MGSGAILRFKCKITTPESFYLVLFNNQLVINIGETSILESEVSSPLSSLVPDSVVSLRRSVVTYIRTDGPMDLSYI